MTPAGPAPKAPDLQLGLIGGNIAASRAPLLHRLAGQQNGMDVAYDRLVPAEMGQSFDEVFAGCARGGFRGVNVTYPFKELAAAKVTVEDPLMAAIGAVNTVIFEDGGPKGHNTDYSGFIAAYRLVRGEAAPGATCMLGAGGVGRAVGFALLAMGASSLTIFDTDSARAGVLADALRAAGTDTQIRTAASAAEAAESADGLINCTPLGMEGRPGTPLPRAQMQRPSWAFDAVYTPPDTQFLADAADAGAQIIPGYELFFFQGVHAWQLFAGRPLDEAALRRDLDLPEASA